MAGGEIDFCVYDVLKAGERYEKSGAKGIAKTAVTRLGKGGVVPAGATAGRNHARMGMTQPWNAVSP